MKAGKSDLTREFKRLFSSMDFVSRHPSLNRRSPQSERFADIYQQLGLLWEFLALQCRHTEGWRKTPEGKLACKLCGTIRGAPEHWILLPRAGKKIVGRTLFPNSSETFPNKKAATIVDDTIAFHGATLKVAVQNAYRARWFRRRESDISISADRIVRLEEDSIECWIDTHLAKLTLRKHKRGERPPYGTFLFELPKRALKRFPILVEYDGRGKLVGVTIFRPNPPGRRRKPPRQASPGRNASRVASARHIALDPIREAMLYSWANDDRIPAQERCGGTLQWARRADSRGPIPTGRP